MTTITKLEAARRQLDCAIRLYLNQDDLLSIQTLAWTALMVLIDYDQATNAGSSWANVMRSNKTGVDRQISTFLKHAKQDPHAVIHEFDEDLPELVFHAAMEIYRDLGGFETKEMEAARTIITIKNGYHLDRDERAERRREEERERERRFEDLYEDDEIEAQHQEEFRRKRLEHEARLNVGRAIAAGKNLFSE